MSIFKKFNPDFQLEENANIILIDNGDGEIIARGMKWRNGAIESDTNGSYVNSFGLSKKSTDRTKLATILVSYISFEDMDTAEFEGGTVLRAIEECDTPPSTVFFTHYKKLPQFANDLYTRVDDTIEKRFSYGVIMAESFNCILEGIFHYRNFTNNISIGNKLESDLPTYIFVGRPSSKQWEEQEVLYQKILSHRLHDYTINMESVGQGNYEFKKNSFNIFAISEADAAYAQLVCRERQGKPLPDDEYVILIDMGSSTADITVVQGSKVILKDSRTIGGGELDQCILDVIKQKTCVDKYPDWEIVRARQIKEAYYNNPKMEYSFHKENFDEKLMKEAIECVKVYSQDEKKEYPSWKECIRSFYKDVKMEINKSQKPSKLLVTGGVSNMPCVLEWATEIFGVDAHRPKKTSPSESVVNGLAYIAEKELQIEHFRGILRKEVAKLINTASNSFETSMAYGQGKNLYDQLLKNLKRWRDETECYNKINSLKDFCDEMGHYTMNEGNVFGPRTAGEGTGPGMRLGMERWFGEKDIAKELLDLIENTFRGIFPEASINIGNLFDISQAISDVVRACANGDFTYHYKLVDTMKKILSDNYNYCYTKRAPRYSSETVVEKEGVPVFGFGRKEHTLYSVDDIVYKVSRNEDTVIRGMSDRDQFDDGSNRRFRESCKRVLEHIKTQIIESVDRFASELTPYDLLTER